MSDAARLKSTVHVSSLPPPCTVATLHAAFLPFGEIVEVTLPQNDGPRSGGPRGERTDQPRPERPDGSQPHRGFGYVEFTTPVDAVEAIENMDQSELFGKVIRVSQAKERKDKNRNEGLGSRTAVWQQETWLKENAVSEEDKLATEQAHEVEKADPMEGLEGLDVAGPKLA